MILKEGTVCRHVFPLFIYNNITETVKVLCRTAQVLSAIICKDSNAGEI